MESNRHRSETALCGEAGTESVDRSPAIGGLIGESDLMQEVRRDIEIAASLDMSVLIIGEPGTGKELVPRTIHDASGRRGRPFVTFNCVGLNPDLIERELFGHEKGAFTGALTRRIGCFEQANRGTLFLNEIGDLSLASQSKLLRVLDERKFERVGGTESIKIDTRLIATTNRDLLREIDEGRFRRGLYDHLRGYLIRMPTLREHIADIPLLIRRYYPFIEFEEGDLELFCHYDWPGNVRELRFMIERLVAKAGGRMITTDHVRREIDAMQRFAHASATTGCFPLLRNGETHR